MTDENKKDIEEVIAEKNAEERKNEAERDGTEHRTQPSAEKKDNAIESITKDIPPDSEKVNLLDKLKDRVGMKTKPKPTTTTTKKGDDSERVPEKQNTESEEVKQSKVRNKQGKDHAFNDAEVCVRCGVEKASATTDCFGRPLPVVTARKVKEGFADFVNGAWTKKKPCDDDDLGKDDNDDEGEDDDEKEED